MVPIHTEVINFKLLDRKEKNYLLVNGSVPGNKGHIVQVQSAVKVN